MPRSITGPQSDPGSTTKSVRQRPPARLVLTGVLCFAIAGTTLVLTRFIVLNLSPSVPLGLYVEIDDEPSAGQLVEFQLPPHVMDGGRYARHRVILKPIAAGPGDHVDTTGDWLWINGQRIAPIFKVDSTGVPLPVWRANRALERDEFFVFSARVPNSFDSRYHGPIRSENIIAVRKPLWTWGADVEAIANDVESTHAGGNP